MASIFARLVRSQRVSDINPESASSSPAWLTAVDKNVSNTLHHILYFSATDDSLGRKLWKYDPLAPQLPVPQQVLSNVEIIDDIGYVQQSREEMEVLFTLIADRYERTSIMISSNLPFSKGETEYASEIHLFINYHCS